MVTVKGEADQHKEPMHDRYKDHLDRQLTSGGVATTRVISNLHFVTLCHSMVLYLSNATLQLAVVHLEVDRHRIFVFLQRVLDQRARCVRTSLPSSKGIDKRKKRGNMIFD